MKLFGFEINKANKPTTNSVEVFEGSKFHFAKNNKYNYNEPIQEVINEEYVLFGQDNLYPNHLNELFYASPFHSSIINFKSINLVGGGIDMTYDITATEKQKIEGKMLDNKFNTLFLNQLSYDFLVHSRICHKVYWNDDHSKIIKVERIDPSWVRYGKKIEGEIRFYFINPKWGRSMNRSSAEKIPAFDKFRKDEKCQLYVSQTFSPGLEYYAQPVYANAANWIFLDGQISFYHKSNIENSINPSMAIKVYERPANLEEQQSFIRGVQQSFAGASNTGKVMVFYSNGKDLSPDIVNIESNSLDEAFVVTQETIIKNIAFSHSIDPIIMGIASPGALGQSQQLETAYNIFKNTFIIPSQKHLESVLNFYVGVNNVPVKIKLNLYNIL